MDLPPGTPQDETAARICPGCGAGARPRQRFCTQCGRELPALVAPAPIPSPTALDAVARSLPAPQLGAREAGFAHGFHRLPEDPAAAARAFAAAAAEQGTVPPQDAVLAALGLAEARAGAADRALRAFLEAALAAPGRFVDLTAAAFEVLAPEAAMAQRSWVLGPWLKQARRLPLGEAERARLHLLLATIRLLLGEVTEALGAARLAGQAQATTAADLLALHVEPLRLPPQVAADDGERELLLGRLAEAVGDTEAAVAHTDRALAALALGRGGEEQAAAQAECAELLARLGEGDQAARTLVEAAQARMTVDGVQQSLALLERAAALDPGNADIHWATAEARRIATHRPGLVTDEKLDLIRHGRAAWQAGFDLYGADAPLAFGYAVRAAIASRSAEIESGPAVLASTWEAVTFSERAVLLTPRDENRWAELANHLRRAELKYVALDVARRAARPNNGGRRSVLGLNEVVISLANLGFWDEGVAELAELEALERSAWTAFVASRLELYHGRGEPALARIEEALQGEPRNLSYLASHGLALRHMGRRDESRDIARAILARYSLEDIEFLSQYAMAALELGDLDRALSASMRRLKLADGIPAEMARVERDHGVVLLVAGRTEEGLATFRHGCEMAMDREERWLLSALLDDAEVYVRGQAAPGPLRAVAEMRRIAAASPLTSEEAERREFEAVARDEPWSWAAAHAVRARLDLEDGDAFGAASKYAELEERPDLFPEAGLGLELAIAELGKGMDVGSFWDRWAEVTPRQIRDGYLAARFSLDAAAAPSAGRTIADAHRIAVELRRELLPGATGAEMPILQRDLPKLRERLQAETGVTIPGVRIWRDEADQLPEGDFRVLLGEMLALQAHAVHGSLYALAPREEVLALGIPAAAVAEQTDGPDDGLACWVQEAHAPALTAAGVAVLADAQAYAARRLEAVLRANLADLLGMDEAEAILRGWAASSGRRAKAKALCDGKALPRVTGLLRRLLREGVPLLDSDAVLDAIAEHGLLEPTAPLRAIRLRMRERLPGNAPGRVRFALPAETERGCLAWLEMRAGKTFLALTRDDAMALLRTVREVVAGREHAALVVADATLRPYLADFLRTEFPELAVLAEEEALDLAGTPRRAAPAPAEALWAAAARHEAAAPAVPEARSA